MQKDGWYHYCVVDRVNYFISKEHACKLCGATEMQLSERNIRKRNGSPEFYKILEEMADTHDRKSHDYADNSNPFGNYHFAGELSKLFNNPLDAGFVGRIGEKLYRLANLENSNKVARNESIEDTEKDLCVIMALWMADRRTRRLNQTTKDLTPVSLNPESTDGSR